MSIVYDFIFLVLSLVYFPYLVISRKWHNGYFMRFGHFQKSTLQRLGNRQVLWVHAVSVGEVLAICGFLRKLKEAFSEYHIVCSTVTPTGFHLAKEKMPEDCTVIYAPLDFSWVVRRFINAINPKIYISAETEIWPNLYAALHKCAIPIVMINGRISDKAFKGYTKVRWLTKRTLACVSRYGMQSALDADRIIKIGAKADRVDVVGNLKFDDISSLGSIRKEDLGFRGDDDILIAGSTHPGEEEMILQTYGTLAEKFERLRLVIAPRHAHRASAIAQMAESKGFRTIRYPRICLDGVADRNIVIVDTIGHLQELYRLASIVFIGKTFCVGGGQNMIEPCRFGKLTIVGPMTQNFTDVMNIFLNAEAIIQVRTQEGLTHKIDEFLKLPHKARAVGLAALKTVKKHQGATMKTVNMIREVLQCRRGE